MCPHSVEEDDPGLVFPDTQPINRRQPKQAQPSYNLKRSPSDNSTWAQHHQRGDYSGAPLTISSQGKHSPFTLGPKLTSPAKRHWAAWPGNTPSALSGSTSRNQQELQQHQRNQAYEKNTTKPLRIKLSLEPQPTGTSVLRPRYAW